MGAGVKNGLCTSETPLKETNFSFKNGFQLEIVSGLEVWSHGHVYAQPWDPHLLQTCVALVYASTVSESSYVHQSLFTWCSQPPWLL